MGMCGRLGARNTLYGHCQNKWALCNELLGGEKISRDGGVGGNKHYSMALRVPIPPGTRLSVSCGCCVFFS